MKATATGANAMLANIIAALVIIFMGPHTFLMVVATMMIVGISLVLSGTWVPRVP